MPTLTSVTKYFTKAYEGFSTTLNGSIDDNDTSATYNAFSGYTNGDSVFHTIDGTDSGGTATPSLREVVYGEKSTLNLINMVRGVEGTAQSHASGAVVADYPTAAHWSAMSAGLLLEHASTGIHDATIIAKLAGAQTFTGVKTFSTGASISLSPGTLINGKIAVSVASSDITVAIQTAGGSTPSASDPVYARIGNTTRAITGALSVTKNDGTNWFGSGGTMFATLEMDYFVYLGYNATDGVTIGFSRIPYATRYDDFSATSTNEKYCAISTITNASASDVYENVGRFNAILSATASFNWSLPATSIIVQRPILETRWLSFVPTWTGFSSAPAVGTGQTEYRVQYTTCDVALQPATAGTSNSTAKTATLPFSSIAAKTYDFPARVFDNGGSYVWTGLNEFAGSTPTVATFYSSASGSGWTASGSCNILCNFRYRIA